MKDQTPAAGVTFPRAAISKFLIARVTEDEAVLKKLASAVPAYVDDSSSSPADALDIEQLLADCRAKRAIVEWFEFFYALEQDTFSAGALGAFSYAMRELVDSYKNHPDWKEDFGA